MRSHRPVKDLNLAAILTYHRIGHNIADQANGSRGNGNIYDISTAVFRRQMEMVGELVTGRQGAVHELTDGQKIVLTFDDGTDDHWNVAHLLDELGLKGIFFVIVRRLGQVGYLTREQVKSLASRGHVIGSHTMSHNRFDELSRAVAIEECVCSRSELEDLTGSPVHWFAFPGGLHKPDTTDAARVAGFRTVRTMEWGYASPSLEGVVPTFPVTRYHTLENVRKIIDGRAIMWPYHAKNCVKKILPHRLYKSFRDCALPWLVGSR